MTSRTDSNKPAQVAPVNKIPFFVHQLVTKKTFTLHFDSDDPNLAWLEAQVRQALGCPAHHALPLTLNGRPLSLINLKRLQPHSTLTLQTAGLMGGTSRERSKLLPST